MPHAESPKSRCGYCTKPANGHTADYIDSPRMRCEDYQQLMDRGWRRCGTQFYKWDFEESCCQPYTIRLDVGDFAPSASQLKVLKRFNKFLAGDIGMDGKITKVLIEKS